MTKTGFIYFSNNDGPAIQFEDTVFIFAIYIVGFTVVIISFIIEVLTKSTPGRGVTEPALTESAKTYLAPPESALTETALTASAVMECDLTAELLKQESALTESALTLGVATQESALTGILPNGSFRLDLSYILPHISASGIALQYWSFGSLY